ncbi:MAG: methylmalonyl Co-A mutase-associated GTPase MeaB [Planctomycetota bacterium]|nr:methylmalonyl Co-A mutase-associated GTPase MeaB [Planctomycetota bacterium]
MKNDTKALLKRLYNGDRTATARLITLVENNLPAAEEIMEEVSKHIGKAIRVGITGPPGVGKSTLVDFFAKKLLSEGKRVGIIAIDPSSPFTGGALLGDRIRMREISCDERVFIRSMASRGRLGGLSASAVDASDILDAMGCDVVIIETVGVGQTEVEIAQVSDICILILSPESGDSVQTLKAGLMEIADIYVVNKSDREGADKLQREIEAMLEIQDEEKEKKVVLRTEAIYGKGVDELVDAVKEYFAKASAERLRSRRVRMAEYKILAILEGQMRQRMLSDGSLFKSLSEKVAEGEITAHSAARRILDKALEG